MTLKHSINQRTNVITLMHLAICISFSSARKARLSTLSKALTFLITIGCTAALLFATSVGLTQSNEPHPETWIPDGPVFSITPVGDTIYIGGDFSYVGPNAACGSPIDTFTGKPQPGSSKINGPIWACISDGSGGWYIGGEFTKINSTPKKNLAHILPNGSVDVMWNPDPNGAVRAVALGDSALYVGGDFDSIGGKNRSRIAAIRPFNGMATSWNPGADASVYALAVSGTTIYAGGAFTSMGGQTRNHIAALDAYTGQASAWNPDANGGDLYPRVYALAISGSTVYVGGLFARISGQNRNNIAALDASTGLATSWNPNANNHVKALAISGSAIYAGGLFTNIGGQSRNCIAALSSSSGIASSWDPHAYGGGVSAIVISGSQVFAGGDFTKIGGKDRKYAAAINATTGQANSWNPNLSGGGVSALSVYGSMLYAGGSFTRIGGVTRNNIAAISAATGEATSWNPIATGQNAVVSSLVASGSTIYVGGFFNGIGGANRNCIAAVDRFNGYATSWDPNPVSVYSSYDVGIYAIAISGSIIYVGGQFTSIGGQSRYNLAALDMATGLATPWNPVVIGFASIHASVSAILVSGSTIYIGGAFDQIGYQTRKNIAAIDAFSGLATSWNPSASGGPAYPMETRVGTLVLSGSTIFAGGNFKKIGGQDRSCIAALDLSSGLATSWNAGAIENPNLNYDPYVIRLAISGSTIFAGGEFFKIGGQNRRSLAALDISTGQVKDWNPIKEATTTSSLAVCGIATANLAASEHIFVGGAIFAYPYQGQNGSYFADFDAVAPPPTPTPSPVPATRVDSWSLYR